MSKSRTRRPSAAMIVAALALTVALGGTAIAADSFAKLTKSKVKAIAGKEIEKRAPGLTVGQAATVGADGVGATALRAVVTKTASGNVAPGTKGDFTATCDSGQQVLSGGVSVPDSDTTAVQLLRSFPDGNGWRGIVYSTSASAHVVVVQALCLSP